MNGGDILEIFEGHDGKPIYVNENSMGNKANLACHVIKNRLMPTGGDIDPGVSVTNVLSRLANNRYQQVFIGTVIDVQGDRDPQI